MKLALKFTLSFVASLCLVLAVYAFVLSEQEVNRLKRDTEQDQRVLGHALALGVLQEWSTADETAAMDFIRRANRDDWQAVQVNWVWISDEPLPGIPPEKWETLRRGQQVSWTDDEPGSPGHLLTLTPVRLPDGRSAAVQIRESLADEVRHIHNTVRGVIVATASVVGLSACLSVVLGIRVVGRPVSRLIMQAREVASGRFEKRLDFHQRDELGVLAGELNKMCEHLTAARNRVASETAARINTLEQLRHADRLKTVGQLASGIAHELGTPLNVVRARAKMVAIQEQGDPDARQNAQIVVEQADRMIAIIRQLLDFARPRLPRRVDADLRLIVQKTADLLTTMAVKKGISIRVECAEQDLLVAEVDPDQLQQVLSNLMLNAIQAMERGGDLTVLLERRAVSPRCEPPSPPCQHFMIEVRDRGPGIEPDHLARVFEPFFTTKQVGEGTGLGLSVSRGIINEHGGWIAVTSKPGEGSSFSVYLPRRKRDAARPSDR